MTTDVAAARGASAAPVAGDPARRLRARRLRQITGVSLVVLLGSVVPDLASASWSNAATVLVAAGALMAVIQLAERGRTELATSLLLWSLLAMLSFMAWRNAGLRDTAVLAFPGILLFAAMLGSTRLFVAMLVAVLGFMVLLWIGHMQGWHSSVTREVSGGTLIDQASIVVVTGLTAWLMASDQRRATRELREQHRQVVDLQERTAWIATHDGLTQLPNRVLARDRFERAAAEARRTGRRIAVLFLDLDNFKHVNDSLGHACGDELLRVVGDRLRALLRASDTVCRLGGDEFLALLPDPGHDDDIAALAERVLMELARPVRVGGREVPAGASMGIAVFPQDGGDFDALRQVSDMAMYRAKESGRNAFRFYDVAMNEGVAEHLQLMSALRAALDRGEQAGAGGDGDDLDDVDEADIGGGELWLAWQPQFDLATGRLVGAEALLRWRHPVLGPVSPARFIPLAEHAGLISRLGDRVLMAACLQAEAWRRAGWDDLMICVNVSPLQFRRGDVEDGVGRALARSRLPADRLELELTESLLLHDTAGLAQTLQRLRAMGVRFAIDDFGTGYSNLAYLKRFEVERLKIDQSFIRRLTQDGQDQTIVRAIVQMAHGLGLSTLAEGIEDAATLAALRALGCGHGQGFHWHPGLPAAEFAERVLRPHLAGGGAGA